MTPTAPRPVCIGRNRRLAPGQRIGAAAGGAVVFPGPFRRREVGAVENVLRRITRLDGDGAVFGQQQHDAHLEHQRGLIGGGPQHVVERRRAGKLAAERVERLGRARPFQCRHCLGAAARRDVGDEHGDQREEAECGEIRRIGESEPEIRRDEKGVIAESRTRCWSAAKATGR